MKRNRYFIFTLVFCCFSILGLAQEQKQVIDEVIAIVGDNVILKSDLEKEYTQMQIQYPNFEGDLKCELLDRMISQKLLLQKAEIDSVVIADEQLEYEINRRLEYFAAQAGGLDALAKYLGVSILEYKDEMRSKIREQMQIQRVQETMLGNVKISPTEVRDFYNEIPKDSIPEFNSEVEIAQITFKPEPSVAAERYALETANRLRAEIVSGNRDFCLTAGLYSADPGSKDNCGDLGFFKRGQMVPAFEAAAFKLKKDSTSEVIKSKFGYHIIQMIERRGNTLHARHILIQATIIGKDYEKAKNKLLVVRSKIESKELDWCKAVNKYSADEASKSGCGFFVDPNSGTNKIEVTNLEPDVALWIEKLKAGEISIPHNVPQRDGSMVYRLLYLKSETPPHKANIKQDYQKISVYALEKKKQDTLLEWNSTFKNDIYIWVDAKYLACEKMSKWIVTEKKQN